MLRVEIRSSWGDELEKIVDIVRGMLEQMQNHITADKDIIITSEEAPGECK